MNGQQVLRVDVILCMASRRVFFSAAQCGVAHSAIFSINQVRSSLGPHGIYELYSPGFDDAVGLSVLSTCRLAEWLYQYIKWISDDKHAWTLNSAGLGPDENMHISQRPVPEEPLVKVLFRLDCPPNLVSYSTLS